jgi:hypothetical protein
MTININSAAFKAALDTMNANQMADMLRSMTFGHFVRQAKCQIIGNSAAGSANLIAAAAVNPYVVAAAQSIALPDDAKASVVARAYGRVGTATSVYLTVDNPDTTTTGPSAGHIQINPNGDLMLNATDAWTLVEVTYHPAIYDVVEVTLPVVSNAIVWPTTLPLALFLMEAEGLAPTDNKLIIDAPASTETTAKHACLNLLKTQVLFTSGDAFTSARLKMAVLPTVDINALLEATSNFY